MDSEYNFLIVSDIHEDIQKTKTLVDLILKNKTKIDCVICCGDIVTIPSDKLDSYDLTKNSDYVKPFEKKLDEILAELCRITDNVVYVPGNHDPGRTFMDPPLQLSSKAKCLHKRYHKLASDLCIVGLGGSTPILQGGKYDPNQPPFHDLDKKNYKWDGYPYNIDKTENNFTESDEKLNKDLKGALTEAKKDLGNPTIILLTHNGPLYTLTNSMYFHPEDIMLYLGSEAIGKIFNEDDKILINIHGHTHDSRGVLSMTEKRKVMNPGNLSSGFYGLLTLKKENNEWTVESTSLKKL